MYYTSGIYVDTLQTTAGCDSIVTMDMTIHFATSGYDTIVSCDSVFWNGSMYSSSGSYQATLTNAVGCDSVVTLALTINYTSFTNDSLVSCDSAMWNGSMYYTSGVYVDTLQTTDNGRLRQHRHHGFDD